MSEKCTLIIGKDVPQRRLRRADRAVSGYVAVGFTFSTTYDAHAHANRVSADVIGRGRMTPDEFNVMLKLLAKECGKEALAWQLMRWMKEEGLCATSTPHAQGT